MVFVWNSIAVLLELAARTRCRIRTLISLSLWAIFKSVLTCTTSSTLDPPYISSLLHLFPLTSPVTLLLAQRKGWRRLRGGSCWRSWGGRGDADGFAGPRKNRVRHLLTAQIRAGVEDGLGSDSDDSKIPNMRPLDDSGAAEESDELSDEQAQSFKQHFQEGVESSGKGVNARTRLDADGAWVELNAN
eukprot:6176321-Pleurochrysis_carterae.AAC.3